MSSNSGDVQDDNDHSLSDDLVLRPPSPPPIDDAENMKPESPPLNLHLMFSGRIIKVLVGAERREWLLHEPILSSKSKFFLKVLQSPFKEGLEGVVALPEEDPKVFEGFVSWLYRRVCRMQEPVDYKRVAGRNGAAEKEKFKAMEAYPEFGSYMVDFMVRWADPEMEPYKSRTDRFVRGLMPEWWYVLDILCKTQRGDGDYEADYWNDVEGAERWQ
ncbi:hypothetical protein QBC44DRAFT_316291 [Cladorrhinum sp. PSN332]|nr:hypothetical protein QBC44DRAFT_316291 [Cladorrhinum sp. PSN332]